MSFLNLRKCIKVSTALVLLLKFQVVSAQVDTALLSSMLTKNKKAIGDDAVMMVWKDGKPIYKKELGDMKASTAAPIASASKWLTAAVVLMLVDEGKLSLDDKVVDYIPLFGKYNKSYITIRHCLTHQTGIEADRGLRALIQRSKYENLEAEVNDFASKRDIVENAGEAFRYSGVGLNIAARICEIVTKKPFDRIAQEKLFRPLGMKQTSFSNESGVGAPNPSGGARSTADDYGKFLNMIIAGGTVNGRKFLSTESIALMKSVQVEAGKMKFAPANASGFSYGLGVWLQETDEKGNGIVISSPGLFGTWPIIDFKKKYAAIIFTKDLLNEEKKDLYLQLFSLVSEGL